MIPLCGLSDQSTSATTFDYSTTYGQRPSSYHIWPVTLCSGLFRWPSLERLSALKSARRALSNREAITFSRSRELDKVLDDNIRSQVSGATRTLVEKTRKGELRDLLLALYPPLPNRRPESYLHSWWHFYSRLQLPKWSSGVLCSGFGGHLPCPALKVHASSQVPSSSVARVVHAVSTSLLFTMFESAHSWG